MPPFADPTTPAIVLTGAAGVLAGKLLPRLRAMPGARLVLLDRRADASRGILAADLGADPAGWRAHLGGADAVMHLAGEPSPTALWPAVVRDNIDATTMLLLEAARAGVRRVVLASSNWVLAGHRFTGAALDAGTAPAPVNPYGVSKLACERAGAAVVACHPALSVIALRIGYCPRDGRAPGSWMRFGRWGQAMWLAEEDWARAAMAALTADASGFAVVNVMSRNDGSAWDLAGARRVTGWAPREGHAPRVTRAQAARERVVRARHALLRRWSGPFRGWDW